MSTTLDMLSRTVPEGYGETTTIGTDDDTPEWGDGELADGSHASWTTQDLAMPEGMDLREVSYGVIPARE